VRLFLICFTVPSEPRTNAMAYYTVAYGPLRDTSLLKFCRYLQTPLPCNNLNNLGGFFQCDIVAALRVRGLRDSSLTENLEGSGMSRGLGRVQWGCLLAIWHYERSGEHPSTFDIAAEVYKILSGHSY